MSDGRLLCPSSHCAEGAVLVGVVLADGRIGYAADRIEVDAEFVRVAREGRAPEKRFRFASPCARCACSQWTGVRCGVIDRVVASAPAPMLAGADTLPACSVRSECRWFHQRGAQACGVCPFVITDLRDDRAPAPSADEEARWP